MTAKKAEPFIVLADTREQAIPPVPEIVVVQRKRLKEGDYSTPALERIARIERKSITDLASTLSWGRERFERELERLKSLRFTCICVEGDVTQVYRVTQMHPHAILGSLSAMLARWECPVLFCGNEAGCGRVMVGT